MLEKLTASVETDSLDEDIEEALVNLVVAYLEKKRLKDSILVKIKPKIGRQKNAKIISETANALPL
jgi:hypothetical protein